MNRVHAIFAPIGLALHQQHLFRQAIGRVGLFGIAEPKVVFAERDGRVFGIAADGANADEFVDAGAPRVFQQQRAHHDVVIKEETGMDAIDADAADIRRQVNDHGRLWIVGEEALHGIRFAQVIIAAAWHDDLAGAIGIQFGDDMPPQEAGAPGYDHGLSSPIARAHRQTRLSLATPV